MKKFSPARKTRLQTQTGQPDRVLLFLIPAVVLFGLVMVTNASAPQALSSFGDRFYFAKQQILWAVLGLSAFFVASRTDHRIWEKLAVPLFVASLVLLLLTLIPEIGVKLLGARRWLSLGPVFFQPSEVAKLTLVLFLAKELSREEKRLLFLLGAIAAVALLVIAEPDFGTAVVLTSSAFLTLFAAGFPLIWFLAAGAAALVLGMVGILIAPYRRERLLSFLTGKDPLGSSYHIRQVLLALGSGGLFGVGLGQSRQKYLFLPEATTDSIFAIIAEELGFFGTTVFVVFFVFLILRMLKIASQAPDSFSSLVATGVASWIGVQTLLNLSSMTALAPLTGVPLPLISYGGSSLFVTLLSVGIVVNISKQRMA